MNLLRIAVALSIAVVSGAACARTTLVIDSWRDDDRAIWEEKIIPAFEAVHPGIGVRFRPSVPTAYDTELETRLEAGTAGDLIACRAFDASLALFEAGHLSDLSDLAGLAHFSPTAKLPWQTDDGSTTFCVPVSSVIHGFLYNREAFRRLGLAVPETETAFFEVLEKFRADGTWVPLAMGIRDRWEAAAMGYNNIGPNHWKGEEGRRALIAGKQKLTDEPWIAPFRTLAKWHPYLGTGYKTRTYRDSQDLFARGRAAIYPAGSWEIAGFNARAGFGIGAFPPPVQQAGDPCYISDHTDLAFGLNSASLNAEAARVFLDWVASSEFASLYATALPGFFPLSGHAVQIGDPVARTFLSWRDECHSTIRFASQFLSRGTPDLAQETWNASVGAITRTATAEELGARLQKELASWYMPQQ